MGRETILFTSKETRTRGEVARFLSDLAQRVEAGQVVLRQGSDKVVLNLSEQVVLQLKSEDEEKSRKGTQHSLKIEVKWYDAPEGARGGVELG
ncbi:MAG TPA: amphi-Trp domain-containing protein [Rhodobacteraceae bacterium]|nr:amphi-Trp domain-containing protein [Paracoccaceae bacterium]